MGNQAGTGEEQGVQDGIDFYFGKALPAAMVFGALKRLELIRTKSELRGK